MSILKLPEIHRHTSIGKAGISGMFPAIQFVFFGQFQPVAYNIKTVS
jgi:hypothetical protein